MFEESMYALAIKGTCVEMCPKTERQTRKKTNRVHKLERFLSATRRSDGLMDGKSDGWMVKEYRRPAAGTEIYPSDLRSSYTLHTTTLHLINRVLTTEGHSFLNKYYFIFDRLRAIQQDATTQCHHDNHTILTLLITIRFLIYASYTLCEENDYDNNINNTLLNQCILTTINLIPDLFDQCWMDGVKGDRTDERKDGLKVGGKENKEFEDGLNKGVCKDEHNFMRRNVKKSGEGSGGDLDNLVEKLHGVNLLKDKNGDATDTKHKDYNVDKYNKDNKEGDMIEVMCEVLGYHVLNNLHSPHAIVEALLWKDRLRHTNDSVLHTSIQIWLHHSKHNYHRCLHLSTHLLPLHVCLFNQHLTHIQTAYLQRLTHAFSSRNNHYNLPHLASILHIPNDFNSNQKHNPNHSHSTATKPNIKNLYPTTTKNLNQPHSAHFLSSYQGLNITDDKVTFDRKTFLPPHPLPTTTHPCIDILLPSHTNNLPSILIPKHPLTSP